MPYFAMYCLDGEKGAELRPQVRENHLAHLRSSGMVRLAGPMLDEAGKPVGSLLVVEAEGIDAARSFAATDPYAKAGVFASVEIRPYAISILDMPQSL
jgi:uncharacterized protein